MAIFKEYYTSAIKRANGDIIFAGNNGISKLEDGKFEQLLASSVFQNYQINSVTEDHLKRLWVGTEGGGVFIWLLKKPRGYILATSIFLMM